ncbi:MAG: cytochrome b/b6 domain-containing protein [Arenimonas sp.]|nr:cytochrome b/b6 domain-containing protein [Rhizobium sp.]MBW8445125.1 cytochrome b/b6 domain-containing protein [Arenimonas sp.]
MVRRIVKVYPRFERLWHWSQVLLIFTLLFTGMGISGIHSLLPFGPAVILHTIAAMALLLLWLFAFFWLFTTGTWRQFVPSFNGVIQILRFYAWGVFKGEEHPYRKIYWRKHNPLQILTYFGLKAFIFPAIWITGLLYLSYDFWDHYVEAPQWLALVANLHLLTAYVIAAFVVIHVYLLTVGHGFVSHVKPMLTGFDEIDLTPEQERYLETNEPQRLRDERAYSET